MKLIRPSLQGEEKDTRGSPTSGGETRVCGYCSIRKIRANHNE